MGDESARPNTLCSFGLRVFHHVVPGSPHIHTGAFGWREEPVREEIKQKRPALRVISGRGTIYPERRLGRLAADL